MPRVQSTADLSDSTSATLTDVTGCSFPVAAGRMYKFKATVPYTTAATTTGIGLAIDTPASPTFFVAIIVTVDTTTVGTGALEADATVTDAEQTTFAAAPATSGGLAIIEGYCKPSVAGEIKLQFNTEVNSSAVTVKAGAEIEYRDLGAI